MPSYEAKQESELRGGSGGLIVSVVLAATLIAVAGCHDSPNLEAYSFTSSVNPTPWRQARPERRYEAEIGRIAVPEVRSDPQSRSIEIAFIRVPSRSLEPDPPTFIFTGGPGGSSTREVEWYAHLIPELLQVGDVIGVDQRGVGRLVPNLDREFSRDLPIEEPTDPEEILQAYNELAAEVQAYWSGKGVDLAGYNTRETADDVEAVRRALGYDRINLLGVSYGSHIALSVIRRHGLYVAKAVLIGVEGPNHTFKTPGQIQEGLERVAAVVEGHPTIGSYVPDFMALVERVLERVEWGGATGDLESDDGRARTVPITPFDVRVWLANAIGRKERLQSVPRMLIAMDHGDFSVLAPRIERLYRNVTVWSPLGPIADCASGMTAERSRMILEEAPGTTLGHVVDFPFPEVCSAWDHPDLADEFRGPLRSDVHTLFLAGDLDSRTPISNARELMRGFPNGTLVVVRNAGHDSRLFESDGSVQAVSRFLMGEPVEQTEIVLPPVSFDPIEPANAVSGG